MFDDPEMLAAITAINRQVRELAPVLNRPSVLKGVVVDSSTKDAPIAWMLKRNTESLYLFAVLVLNSNDFIFIENLTANLNSRIK